VFEWHSRSKAGRVSVEDDECSGWPSTSKMTKNVEKIRGLIHEDHRWTIHELADIFWDTREKIWIEKARNFGATTTTRPHTPLWKPQSLWLITTWLSFPSFLTCWTWTLWFRFVTQFENETEGTTFWNGVWHPKGIASSTR
jgi:hypothetical protein